MNANIQKAIWDNETVTIGGGQFNGEELAVLLNYAKIGQAVEMACRDLPVGFEIVISLEKNAGAVALIDPDGNEYDIEGDGPFSDTIRHAITTARSLP